MQNIQQLETLYAFVIVYIENKRISVRELHRKYSHYKNQRSTSSLIKESHEKEIICGPKIWVNSGFDVTLIKNRVDDPLELFENKMKENKMTYIMALEGAHSFLFIKKGASILKYAEAIKPTFPAIKQIEDITLDKIGRLEPDPYPHGWDELDWEVYNHMRDPLISFWKVGENLGVSWHTVKNRFEKIVKDCKTWIAFFPRGYHNYSQALLTFKTEYEVGLREELKKLDRTTFLYKFEDKIMLHLFYDNSFQHYIFSKMKKKGKIHDLHVSIPVRYYSSI